MTIDWNVVATIASPVIALVVGMLLNRWFESRPILISYFGHISSFQINPPNKSGPTVVHTHAVVLKNAGRRTANNIRLHHNVLPDFDIYPAVPFHIETLPNNTQDIVIPKLVPKKEIAISYLYFPPLTAAGVNAGIESDEGFAEEIPVLIQRRYPRWFNLSIAILFLIGAITTIYFVVVGLIRLIA